MFKFVMLVSCLVLVTHASPVRERRFLGFGMQKELNIAQSQGPVFASAFPAKPVTPPPPPVPEEILQLLPASNLSPIMLGSSPLEILPGGLGKFPLPPPPGPPGGILGGKIF